MDRRAQPRLPPTRRQPRRHGRHRRRHHRAQAGRAGAARERRPLPRAVRLRRAGRVRRLRPGRGRGQRRPAGAGRATTATTWTTGRLSLDRLLVDEQGQLDDAAGAALLARPAGSPRTSASTGARTAAPSPCCSQRPPSMPAPHAGSATRSTSATASATRPALRFLADASEVLASSLDYEQTLQRLAELAVPHMADWCTVSVLEGGEIANMAVAHSDPRKIELAHTLQREYPPDPNATSGAAAVIRRGHTEFLPEIPDELLVAAAPDERLLAILRDLGLRSVITAPLTARGRTFGALSLVAAESGRRTPRATFSWPRTSPTGRRWRSTTPACSASEATIADTLQAQPAAAACCRRSPASRSPPSTCAGGDGVEVGGDFYDVFETGPGRWTVDDRRRLRQGRAGGDADRRRPSHRPRRRHPRRPPGGGAGERQHRPARHRDRRPAALLHGRGGAAGAGRSQHARRWPAPATRHRWCGGLRGRSTSSAATARCSAFSRIRSCARSTSVARAGGHAGALH